MSTTQKRIMIAVGVVIAAVLCFKVFFGAPTIEWASEDPFIHAYDSHKASSEARSTESFEVLKGWKVVKEENTTHSFKGDAVFHNDKIIVIVRKSGHGVELYSITEFGPYLQATLIPMGNTAAERFSSLSIVENSSQRLELDVVYTSGDGSRLGMNLELMVGQTFVKTQGTESTLKVAVNAPTPFVVMPDFFADDIVIHAEDIKAKVAELPSENFLLHMVDDGHAMVLSVWDNRDQEVKVALGEREGEPVIEQAEIEYGSDGNVWVSILADTDIWHTRHISRLDRGNIIELDWQQPFNAVWRVDWKRADKLTDSWEMIVEKEDGKFRKVNLFESGGDEWSDEDWWGAGRTRIAPGMGRYLYPCWFDFEGSAYLQPLIDTVDFRGPAVIYPINRDVDTPLDKFTVTDIIIATLGQGPCEYILDIEGQGQNFQGLPTCAVRDILNAIYAKNQQVSKSAEVLSALDDASEFIRMIRGRIGEYEKFMRSMEDFLKAEGEKTGAPKAFIKDMNDQVAHLKESIELRRPGMQTPAYANNLINQFRNNLVGYDGSDATALCKELTHGFVKIGENQDELVAECRQVVKIIRQRAALAMANDPANIELGKQIRARCQEVLKSPVNYEAPRH